jgi:REP element-mobilizing transposase RayT
LKNRESHVYRINGREDHLHILASLHPSVSLADLVKDIKTGASVWIKKEGVFPMFAHWQDGYAAFTHSKQEIDRLIEYIKGQEEHHRRTSFVEEYRKLLEEAGIEFDERYML